MPMAVLPRGEPAVRGPADEFMHKLYTEPLTFLINAAVIGHHK